ncbi:MAG: maleylpyruvate isomerase family mycothiol-dependent enzyme [Acidimicrobiia bacterium]|nr:maleylpyruvate isomerase family mycothiol-dependent enzyme [Acidimicrobiia bacterium]
MEISEHIAAVANDGKMLAEAAQQAGLEAVVEPCPGWNVRDLVRHLGMIHLWAASHIAFPHDEPGYESEDEEHAAFAGFWPTLGIFWPDDGDLIDWYLRTNANLVDSLESASPNLEAWTFLRAPSPLAMWARRQAHETAVHRFDAQDALGAASEFDPVFAADGIDELLAGFAPRKQEFPIETARAMHVHAVDTDDHWLVTMGPDGIDTSRNASPADVSVSGAASDLYLTLWNRGKDSSLNVEGDRELLDLWHNNVRVRWS